MKLINDEKSASLVMPDYLLSWQLVYSTFSLCIDKNLYQSDKECLENYVHIANFLRVSGNWIIRFSGPA